MIGINSTVSPVYFTTESHKKPRHAHLFSTTAALLRANIKIGTLSAHEFAHGGCWWNYSCEGPSEKQVADMAKY